MTFPSGKSLQIPKVRAVASERNGWRDEPLSRRHREWGWPCPAVDLDFVLAEYHSGRPVAVIDYKHINSAPVRVSHPSVRAVRCLADAARVPFLVAFYDDSVWSFLIRRLNDVPLPAGVETDVAMSERDYVAALYAMRDAAIDRAVLDSRQDVVPSSVHWPEVVR